MKRIVLSAAVCLAKLCLMAEEVQVAPFQLERTFLPARLTCGNTSILPVQEIDQAAWIAHPDDADFERLARAPRAVRYRCKFTSDGKPLTFDVTGDERFLLTLDGAFVSRGPHRGWVENWPYQSYRITLPAGEHVMEATVWRLGECASRPQLSYRPGFCLKAQGDYDAALTTGRGAWECAAVTNFTSLGHSGEHNGMGDGFEIVGADPSHIEPTAWVSPAIIRKPLGEGNFWGLREKGWMLYPSQLPDQLAERVRPGSFVKGGEMKLPLVVPAGETRTILWNLSRYLCAYPEAIVRGGKGGSMTWKWAESLRGEDGFKGSRAAWEGKRFEGYGDRFVFDGREHAVFQPPWFRCGLWCELVIKAGEEPVTIEDLSLIETRYPLTCESVFETPDDASLAEIQRISARTMQMCCHEMLFDCPYYEQQMYPGDTRIQLNVQSAMTADDRMIRRAMDFFALNRREGIAPYNTPTRGTQDGMSYTLCWLGMYADYLMNHANRAWLRASLPAIRDTLSMFAYYERGDGVLNGLPGCNFLDWVKGWDGGCWAPGSCKGEPNAEMNLFYLAALQGASRIEAALGNTYLAAHIEAKIAKLKPAIVAAFFDAERGFLASDASHTVYAEHAQILALLTDVFEDERAQALFERLIAAKDLCPVSVYFSYYLFETYFKFNRADLFMKRLDLWRGYLKLGATTCLEEPEYSGHDSRSDCHAWGAHPLWFLRTGIAGIRSDAPFFERVKIAPQPGGLGSFRASYPHPSGKMIEVNLTFKDGRASGLVTTPVPGIFVYGRQILNLEAGTTEVK